jgi:hypothetical protein
VTDVETVTQAAEGRLLKKVSVPNLTAREKGSFLRRAGIPGGGATECFRVDKRYRKRSEVSKYCNRCTYTPLARQGS